uniref:Uncharacterized protein n=1 Tax=Hyaloperonospora arabidopsidis (strain Emoy2) TaxID=559515 RepID=M4BHD3_HYAAE
MDSASGGVGGEADPREPLPPDPGGSGLRAGPSSPRIGAGDGGSPSRGPPTQDKSLGGGVATGDAGESWAWPLQLVNNPPGEADRTDGEEFALTSCSQMDGSGGRGQTPRRRSSGNRPAAAEL